MCEVCAEYSGWPEKKCSGRTVPKALFTLAFITLGIACTAFCQTTNEPVPTKWLKGGRLVVPDLNFSVDSPTPHSHWTYQKITTAQGDYATAFFAEFTATTKYVVMVGRGGRMDSSDGDRFVKGMQSSLPMGCKIEHAHSENSSVPIKGSTKISVSIHVPGDSKLYAYGYIVPGKRTYTLIDYTTDPTEPLRFTQFVASFALLSPAANALDSENPQNPAAGFILLFAIAGAFFDWRYTRRGGKHSTTRERVTFILAVLGCGALIGFLGVRGASADSLGRLAAFLVTILFGLWELGRWRIRRKYPVSVSVQHL